MEQSAILLSKYQGCLFGLAIGNSLGAPIEFMLLDEIKSRYGKAGVTDFHEWRTFRLGSYTDDTQMAIATAIGCLTACQNNIAGGMRGYTNSVYQYYKEWLGTQKYPALRRSPGMTCLSAIKSGKMGTMEKPINDSTGCGGVMRIAHGGLIFDLNNAFKYGCEFAAITHGHPSGYLTAGFLAQTISHIK